MILLSWKSQVPLFLHSQILIAWLYNLFYLIFLDIVLVITIFELFL